MKNVIQASVILVYERLGLKQKQQNQKKSFQKNTQRMKMREQLNTFVSGMIYSKDDGKIKKSKEQIQY